MTKGAGSVGAFADSLEPPEILRSGAVDPSEAFAEAPFPLDIRDPDGRWLFANEAFLRCFGLTAPLGRSAFECLGHDLAAAFTEGDHDVLRHGRRAVPADVGDGNAAAGRRLEIDGVSARGRQADQP